jgi:glycosyltransferase involved in cell wall biosynthesis
MTPEIKPNPKVSIIIPVYNGSNYLRESIESALSQTYDNLEILVINDGSKDDGKTEEIALSYGDKIRYFHKENGGVASALNLGIEKMEGEWFSWLSHDDLYMPDKIKTQVEYWRNNHDIKILTSYFITIDETGNQVGEMTVSQRPIVRNGRELYESSSHACTLLVQRECFEKSGRFNEGNKSTQDVEMCFKLLRHFHFYCVPEPLVKVREHPQRDTMTKKDQHIKDKIMLSNMMINEFDPSFFYPVDYKGKITKEFTAKAYIWLGIALLDSGSLDCAFIFYNHAYKVCPSPFLSSFYVHFMSRKNFEIYAIIHRRIGKTTAAISKYIKQKSPFLARLYRACFQKPVI